jgi:o-succinylbenzoate---CoA ligase
MKYPHDSITINHRVVKIDDICSSRVSEFDEFETYTFLFIRRWFSSENHFEIQTSGSTGPAKKISFNRDQMIASARMTEKALGLKPAYTALVCLDTRFIAGQMMLVRCFTTGMAIQAVTPSSNPFVGLNLLIDFAALVPYQVYHTLEAPEFRFFNSINTIIVGGAPIDPVVIDKLEKFDSRFFATYGMTETISHVALQQLNGPGSSIFFKVLPGVSVGTDSRNCLTLSVPFIPERIITNDIVELQGSQEFRWLGRWDNVLNSGGVKIIPEKVEEEVRKVFVRLNLQRRFFLSALDDPRLGEKTVLFVEGDQLSLSDQQYLREELPKVLTRYEIPKEVFILKFFEMTQTGKINRFSTRQNSDKSLQKFTLKN